MHTVVRDLHLLNFRRAVDEADRSGMREHCRLAYLQAFVRYRWAGWPFGATEEALEIWLEFCQFTTQN